MQLQKTLAFRNQLTSLSDTIHNSRKHKFCLATQKLVPTTISFLPVAALITLRTSFFPQSFVYTSSKIQVWGRQYSIGNVLVLGKCSAEHELQFGLIPKIIWIKEEKSVYFLVKKLITLGFRSFVNAYIVKERDLSDTADFSFVTVSDLLDPLDLCVPKIGHFQFLILDSRLVI
jgi:hypothetical protein